jgi:putative transcription antitermination factor YqgF
VRYLGLDVGDVRIGVALSDETATLASGLVTLERVGPRKDVKAVAAIVRERDVHEVVVGMPWRLDGNLGPQGEKVMGFVEALRRGLKVPVVTWDERRPRGGGADPAGLPRLAPVPGPDPGRRPVTRTGGSNHGWGRRLRLLLLLVALIAAASWLAWRHETRAPKLSATAPRR